MKKIFTLALALFSVLIVRSPVLAAVHGTAAGSYYYTDIVTYLWNTPVNSINIGGVTLIDAESMSYYGFTVKWHNDERWLEILRGDEVISPEAANGSLLDMKSGKPGTVAGKYYHTDIKTTLDGEQILSYNIDGRTFIGAEALRDFGYAVTWNGNVRTLAIIRSTWNWTFYPSTVAPFDGTRSTNDNGFSYEFTNISKANRTKEDIFNNEGVEFALTEASSLSKYFGRLTFSAKDVTLSNYQNEEYYKGGDYVDGDFINIKYDERIHDDTPERRAKLSQVFRVYVNGVALGGELSFEGGNGHSDISFIFDKPLRLEDVKTLRLEVGYKQ